MADLLHYTIEFTMKPGGGDAFKMTAGEIIELVKAREPGTLNYWWYVSPDETRVILYEKFEDSAALVAHAAGQTVQERLPELLDSSDITRFEVFGEPDAAAAEVLAGFGAVTLMPAMGFSR